MIIRWYWWPALATTVAYPVAAAVQPSLRAFGVSLVAELLSIACLLAASALDYRSRERVVKAEAPQDYDRIKAVTGSGQGFAWMAYDFRTDASDSPRVVRAKRQMRLSLVLVTVGVAAILAGQGYVTFVY